jgi:hypothetical protein
LNSQIIYFFNKNTHTGALTFNMELHYPEESLEELMLIVKTEVVRSALEGDKHMAMFDFARDNEQHAIVCGACLIQPPLFDKSAWVCVLSLPDNNNKTAALIPGRSRLGILEIEQSTNCAIEVVQKKTRESHIYVSGKHSEDVAKCRELLEQRLNAIEQSQKITRRVD